MEVKVKKQSKKLLLSIERIKEAIEIYKESDIKISVTAIGRYCEEKWEGPLTQSIRNNPSLMDIIKDEQKKNKKTKFIPKNKKLIFDTSKIEDENIKTYLRIQDEKYNLLENKYKELKKVFESVEDFDIDKLLDNPVNPNVETRLIKKNINSNSSIDIEDFLTTLNEGLLSKIGVRLKKFSNNGKEYIINENTNSIVYES